MSQTIPTNAFSGNPVPMGGVPMPSPSPESGVFKLRSKSGEVIPIRAASVEDAFDILDEMESNPPEKPYAIPQAMLVGGLKGLGRMAAPLVKAAGLGNDYTDAALAPDNPIEGLTGSAAQEVAIGAATAPLAGPVVRVAGKVLKPLTSRLVPLAKAVAEFSGVGERARKAKKVWDAARGGTARKAESEAASKIKREAAEDAEKILEAKQAKAIEDKVLRRELSDAKKMDKVDRGRQAKAEFEARKAPKQASKASESPQEAPKASSKGSEPQMFDSRTGKPVELSPDEARKAVANQPWNKGKGDVVEAKPAFPGQQSAKGTTKARFASNLDRNVVKWAESGNKPEAIQKKVKSIFKRDLSLDEIDSILIRAKETN